MGKALSYAFSYKEDAERDELHYTRDDNHQNKHHKLPYEHVYTEKTMKEAMIQCIEDEQWYELSVLCVVMENWNYGEYCHFWYQ